MKGNADCHIPSDKYRENYDRIFRKGHHEEPMREHERRIWFGDAEPEWVGWGEVEKMIQESGERLLAEEYPIFREEDRR